MEVNHKYIYFSSWVIKLRNIYFSLHFFLCSYFLFRINVNYLFYNISIIRRIHFRGHYQLLFWFVLFFLSSNKRMSIQRSVVARHVTLHSSFFLCLCPPFFHISPCILIWRHIYSLFLSFVRQKVSVHVDEQKQKIFRKKTVSRQASRRKRIKYCYFLTYNLIIMIHPL